MTGIAKRVGAQPWVPMLLFVGFLALRLPFRAQFLVNWDAVNFALGTQLFSLEHHQPHPPGYVGYVALGWLLNQLTGDANSSLTWLSIISGSAAPAAFFLLASLFMARRYALVSAVLFGLSPVVWYYSVVALTYSLELAMALFFLWAGYKARLQVSLPHLVWATALFILLGSMRQSGALFLMPLWVYMAWAFPWRQRLLAGVVLLGGSLAWLLPLLWLSGGVLPYLRAAAGLADLVVMPTSIFAMDPLRMSQNIGFVLAGVVVGVNLGLLIIAAGFIGRGANPFAVFARHRTLFLLWLVPVLLTYLLLHTGQLGYILLVLPPAFLVVGAALSSFSVRWPTATLQTAATAGSSFLIRHYAVAFIAALLALGSTWTFLVVPQMVYALAGSAHPRFEEGSTAAQEAFAPLRLFHLAASEEGNEVADRARQYNLRLNDAHWNALIRFVESFEPETTAVLTAPHTAGSFRHLTYYLPDYHVYGLGKDLNTSFGHLFTAYGGTSDYGLDGLEEAREKLYLPANVRRLVIPDRDIYQRMQGEGLYVVELESGMQVAVATVPQGTALVFEESGNNSARITLEQALVRIAGAAGGTSLTPWNYDRWGGPVQLHKR